MATMARSAAKPWRIIPRPLLETILNNHAYHPVVPQPLLLHGPRGVGKTSLIRHRLLNDWNKGPHVAGYVDFSGGGGAIPWAASQRRDLRELRDALEGEIESMVDRGVRLGAIGARGVLSILNRRLGILSALRRLTNTDPSSKSSSITALWNKAVIARMRVVDIEELEGGHSKEEVAYMREAAAALRVAREVVELHQEWRKEAVRELNRKGGFSRSLAHSVTDWPCLLLEILSGAAESDLFQPKLVINNIDILRKAFLTDDSSVSAAMYHDSFMWRVIALGVNERCLPVFLVTSDSYYSYQVFIDFGFPDIFLSRETYGWTRQEAKLHMVPDFFSESEWKVIDEVLGPSPRHLSELYSLKQNAHDQEIMQDSSSFEDVVDAYLAYLQVSVVNPAMESALVMLQKFACDVHDGKIPENRLPFGSPWRHPPHSSHPAVCMKWAKLQLMDFVQSFVNAEFGVNYLADYSLEILEDPSAVAMLEVGLLYKQRDPSFFRPITRGVQRCLARWLVHERMQMNLGDYTAFLWQRIVRGRSYRHLMKELGYK
ncbi:P-loop containing nucleoside triphosphate hydrolase protein [Dioscorea alata]|uniref:P-loop containing nucleoside triphosphate hydrolase protein n=3 Tax=Dioscorea alata TaxID=55571 RepID=A0ACB7WA16_DIOAL|nr:P-loop containing nucleoside triphosphate hydrolase protein [Dioscorea alata]KAH7684277.1 P-loop containing nucleoside triphosphate hydrolase protein [Dioscorea alata]KAH7684278.1 P-loop containing nucleoside triphosphate hydrolase protein [Dioscorea alata]